MEEAIVVIMCRGATTVTLDELSELHHFKTTTDKHYAECRNSLTELGFSFPFFMWVDPTGKKWTVDGHRRLYTLKRMRDEGIPLPDSFPADLIFAKDKKEAAKKVVANESRYGDPNESDFADFLQENEIAFEELENFMDIPGIDDKLWTGDDDTSDENAHTGDEKKVTCPNCQTVFTV